MKSSRPHVEVAQLAYNVYVMSIVRTLASLQLKFNDISSISLEDTIIIVTLLLVLRKNGFDRISSSN